jgi:hypothetical protein
MADWFETRFRERVETEQPDPAFVARMRELVVDEWQADAGTTPPDEVDTDDQEGDIIMLETEERPTDDEPGAPHPRSPGTWLLVAAAAAVVAGVGALLVVAGSDDEDPVDTVDSPATTTVAPGQEVLEVPGGETFVPLEPGRYFVDPDGDDTTPLRVTYEVAAEGWDSWFGALKFAQDGVDAATVLSITTVTNLVTDGCLDHTPLDPPVGPTVEDLATALTQLAPFEVTAPPTDVNVFGYPGQHLELTVPDGVSPGCLDGDLDSWISPVNGGAFSGYDGPGQTEEFWILDVEGTRLVFVKLNSPVSPAEDAAELDAIFDSITIEP